MEFGQKMRIFHPVNFQKLLKNEETLFLRPCGEEYKSHVIINLDRVLPQISRFHLSFTVLNYVFLVFVVTGYPINYEHFDRICT